MKLKLSLITLIAISIQLAGFERAGSELSAAPLTITPAPYDGALRNPLKGFTSMRGKSHPWATLQHYYISWEQLEDSADDGMERILEVTNRTIGGLEGSNEKAILRVYLHYSGDRKHWPSDMTTDDYTSEQFQRRLVRLVQKLGLAWDNDPRIAFIEMGIFGKWGEHHGPSPTEALQKIAGDAFAQAFQHKKVLVRHAWKEFTEHPFGQYWDSWAHYDQTGRHGVEIREMIKANQTHLYNFIGGEVAYDWGEWYKQPGRTQTDSVAKAEHRDFIINTIRWLHCTQLRWISAYDQSDPAAAAGAEEMQKVFGYRFQLESVGISMADGLTVALNVKNEGSAPFYYDWPVEVSLLATDTLQPVWSSIMESADIRTWHPGSDWTEPTWKPVGGWKKYEVSDNWSEAEAIGWGNHLGLTRWRSASSWVQCHRESMSSRCRSSIRREIAPVCASPRPIICTEGAIR